MKALNRILRIALASTLALSQGAWFPALAASGKHQAVIAIGADELKSEYGAGGGGGGTDPAPCTNSTGMISTRATCNTPPVDTGPISTVDEWAYFKTESNPEVLISSTSQGPWKNTGPSPLILNQRFDGYCSITGATFSVVEGSASATCERDYGFNFNNYAVPSGFSVNLYKAIRGQYSWRVDRKQQRNLKTNVVIKYYDEYQRAQRYREWTSWSVTGYKI